MEYPKQKIVIWQSAIKAISDFSKRLIKNFNWLERQGNFKLGKIKGVKASKRKSFRC